MLKRYLEIGKIVNTHGIKGELKIDPWCNSGNFLCSFKEIYLNNGENKIKVISSYAHKNVVIMRLDGVDTVKKAEDLKGTLIYINRNDARLEKDEYFIQDIIRAEVFDYDTEELYGKISNVLKTGANDVYEIENSCGKTYLVPVIKDVVKEVDIEKGLVRIVPLKGIFSDED